MPFPPPRQAPRAPRLPRPRSVRTSSASSRGRSSSSTRPSGRRSLPRRPCWPRWSRRASYPRGEAPARRAHGGQAAPVRRPVRWHVAARLHRPRRRRERQPHRLHRQDPLLGLHGHQGHALRGQGMEAERRRKERDHPPAQGHEVVRRHALHRQRLRLLVRGGLPQQGSRCPCPIRTSWPTASRGTIRKVDDATVAFEFQDPELPVRRHPGGQHRHGRRAGDAGHGRTEHGCLHARALHQAVPAQVLLQGGRGEEGQGRGLRRLGQLHQEPLGLAAQSRAARADAVEDRQPHQYAYVGARAQSLLHGRGLRRAISCRTSIASA